MLNGDDLAHNPEVAGSNPAPLPRSEALPIMGGAFRTAAANGFANDVVAHAVSPRSPLPVLSVMSTEASDPPMISSASVVAT